MDNKIRSSNCCSVGFYYVRLEKENLIYLLNISIGGDFMPDNEQQFTNPELHRQIATDDMTSGNHYSVFISCVNSYRAIESPSAHSESSDSDEIP